MLVHRRSGGPPVLRPVGVIRSPWKWREEAPRQPDTDTEAEVVLHGEGMQNALKDVAGFDRIWLLCWFHHCRGWVQQVVPPRDRVKRGVFATRAPDRPNPIGLSCVQVVSVQGRRIRIRGHDLLDGTPVLDIKPYIPAYDSHPDSRAGWVDGLRDPGADHRLRPDPPSLRKEHKTQK